MVDSSLCETCQKNEPKYTCPGCSIRSCSLDCVKKHKSGVDACDGIRRKSSYVPLSQFTDDDLEKDFTFMSSACNTLNSIGRDKLRNITTKGENALPIPYFYTQLINANRIRGCRFLLLPPHFHRHKTNTSRLDFALNRIFWKVDWYFPHANDLTLTEKSMDEMTRPWDYIKEVIYQEQKMQNQDTEKDLVGLNPFIQYASLGFGGFKALLKIEGIQKTPNCSRFEELDLKKSLRANLRDKTVIENPIIYVVLNDHVSSFTVKGPSDSSSFLEGVPKVETPLLEKPKETKKSFGLLSAQDSDSEEESSKKHKLNEPLEKKSPKTPKLEEALKNNSNKSSLFLVHYSDSE
ncbi:box C/D snoRNA protein 1 [Lepeophtheirus salmonis]|uniref:Box C/D snoRNA protein 1 n=1 Tax=Lepeophtheirus salmonis TaxID=72036 RepID=A0A0K2TXR7_LEPSM|nr:box C/D snoRNA protein 1-like [Lepeophtheirus salmonis]